MGKSVWREKRNQRDDEVCVDRRCEMADNNLVHCCRWLCSDTVKVRGRLWRQGRASSRRRVCAIAHSFPQVEFRTKTQKLIKKENTERTNTSGRKVKTCHHHETHTTYTTQVHSNMFNICDCVKKQRNTFLLTPPTVAGITRCRRPLCPRPHRLRRPCPHHHCRRRRRQ